MDAMKKLIRVEEVELSQIIIGQRERQIIGDLLPLASDMSINGLIHPITLDQNYNLCVGYRRVLAAKYNRWDKIRAQILDHPTELDIKEITLSENLHRLDITWQEKLNIQDDIATLKFGVGWQDKMNKKGSVVTMANLAQVFDSPISKVSDDLRIHQAIKSIPGLDKFKNKTDVMDLLKKMGKQHKADKVAKSIETIPMDDRRQQLLDAYKVGDFFDLIKTVPDNSVNCINFDPDWGTKAVTQKALTESNSVIVEMQYTEVERTDFDSFLTNALTACYPKLKDGGWLIHWFDIKRLEAIADITEKCGFVIGYRIPSLWIKGTGQTNKADVYMPRTYEPFFYCRKGTARLKKNRANEIFEYRNPPLKWHPCLKSVELMTDVLSCFLEPGQFLLDAFTGSGTALLAAANLNCGGIGFDLSSINRNNYVIHVASQVPGSYNSYDYKPIKGLEELK